MIYKFQNHVSLYQDSRNHYSFVVNYTTDINLIDLTSSFFFLLTLNVENKQAFVLFKVPSMIEFPLNDI